MFEMLLADVPVDSWRAAPEQLGPVYPWIGSEMWMFSACLVFCIYFMIWKFVSEHKKYDSRARELNDGGGLSGALDIHAPEDITKRKSQPNDRE